MMESKNGVGHHIKNLAQTFRQVMDPAFLTLSLEVLEIGDPTPKSNDVIRRDYGLAFVNHSLEQTFILESYEVDGRTWGLNHPIQVPPRAKREFTLFYSHCPAHEPNRFLNCKNMLVYDQHGEPWPVFLDSAVKDINNHTE